VTTRPPVRRRAARRPAGGSWRLAVIGIALAAVVGILMAVGAARSSTPEQQPAPVAVEAPLDPARVEVASLGISADLEPLGKTASGGWAVPATAGGVSWYEPGTVPGSPGPAVLLGHVSLDRETGVFAELHTVEPGTDVVVTGTDGRTATFRVTRTEQIPKVGFPTERVLAPTPVAELRLITCGGALGERRADGTRHFEDNVIAYAVRVA
jgi:hypothetical protein